MHCLLHGGSRHFSRGQFNMFFLSFSCLFFHWREPKSIAKLEGGHGRISLHPGSATVHEQVFGEWVVEMELMDIRVQRGRPGVGVDLAAEDSGLWRQAATFQSYPEGKVSGRNPLHRRSTGKQHPFILTLLDIECHSCHLAMYHILFLNLYTRIS